MPQESGSVVTIMGEKMGLKEKFCLYLDLFLRKRNGLRKQKLEIAIVLLQLQHACTKLWPLWKQQNEVGVNILERKRPPSKKSANLTNVNNVLLNLHSKNSPE